MVGDGIKDNGEQRNKTASDIYQVQPYYQRFDQKNNMTRQRFWNPPAIELTRQLHENLKENILKNRPGYGLRDWAFYAGATANMTNSGFSINWPNRRGNSWQPLSKLTQSLAMVSPHPGYGKLEVDPSIATSLVKKMGHLFGADEVGTCILDRRWVYSHWFDEETREHYPIKFSDEPGYEKYQEPAQLDDRTQVIPEKMKYAIVLIHEMDERGMATAPTLTQQATTLTVYSRISFITVMLAEFIRSLGYNAIPSANDTALSIPLAIDAGLGELGRNAKLITPAYGPRCRISKVITDLPLEPAEPGLWGVTEFCNGCRKCARNCPAGAIPFGERSFEPLGIFNNRGVLQWQIDHMKCFKYFAKVGTNCGICIRTCPFNKSKHWGHKPVRNIIRMKNRNVDRLIARMDDLLGYGRYQTPDHFWSA
ncbi:MAG: reductive dehalogenase [Chloroflexi bacterium]|nr:reductive dehalogenase [Chloroflexota bacterium]